MNTNLSYIETLKKYMPGTLRATLSKLDSETLEKITEIHIHSSGIVSVCIYGKSTSLTSSGITSNFSESITISQEELDAFIFRACHGSVYTHEESLKEGYFTVLGGIRIGVCGHFNTKNGQISGISKIKGVNIRLPRHIDGASDLLFSHIEKDGFPNGKGILIASSPGVGKTTLLRDLAKKLSSSFYLNGNKFAKRVCVIDERSEIYMNGVFDNCCIDFLSDIPKAKGMEIATRVLSPEFIILDEIGTENEAKEIIKAHSGGVILIASAHSDSFSSLLERPHIKSLIDANVFGGVLCLERKREKVVGTFTSLISPQ